MLAHPVSAADQHASEQLNQLIAVGRSKDLPMEQFIHRQNLAHFRKLLAQATDEAQRRMLLKLIAEEEGKDQKSLNRRQPWG